jgi:putative tryptophan/tyrosine transport system substrate-binding protein
MMRRRAFISLIGGAAAAWPLVARAQQPAMPVVGFLDARTPDVIEERLRAYRRGLKEAGYIEGENLSVLYRFAEGQADRLPSLARDLVERRVAAIGTAGDDVAVTAKAATSTIPVVFIASQDPVKLGLVASLARPGGNATGINFFSGELAAKRLELLRELLPAAKRIAILVNPAFSIAELTLRDTKAAAEAMKLEIQVVNASTRQELDAHFEAFARERPDALFVATDTFFTSRRVQLVQLANRHAMPSTFANREAAEIGGLMSYGSNVLEAWRQAGAYMGRILKGAKPADLPVVQSSKFELVINHQTARMLGITVPQSLLATADEVIE